MSGVHMPEVIVKRSYPIVWSRVAELNFITTRSNLQFREANSRRNLKFEFTNIIQY